ncbi:MAG: M23 family metallopeptidase, partial [Anaerolineae bacterium]|nr:M23 family metallopeptidase [Anaerolineae bacterium]
YQFPWADGAWGTVTRSYDRHGVGRIDFDLSAREVAAAKDGVILYANDSHSVNAYASDAWWYWNTIVIRHGDHEYSLYGHLAPDSIPQWIKDGCSDDLSAANCAVPVQAGQIIALEGSTGFSSNPHLHAEFGQAFAVVAYMDSADEDGDGVRAEPIYTGYVYAEHNIGFSGYTPDEAAAWSFGTLQQATHSDPLPVGINLIRNGDFSAGTDGWTPSGQINWSVQDGMMRFTRLRTTDPPDWAAFYQTLEQGVDAHTAFEATLKLGNASGILKTVTVSVFNRSGRQYGLIECAFGIPPNTSLEQYTLRGSAVNTWASLRFEISVNPPDGSPAALVDDISLRVLPEIVQDECIIPAS